VCGWKFGGAYKYVEFGNASGLACVALGEQSYMSSCLSMFAAVGRAYTRMAGGRSGICKVITPRNIDHYGVSFEADFYESLWDLYSFMFPSKFTSTCLLPAEHAELGQMLGTGSDGVFPYCNVMLEQDVG
jgi:hypothetical protein